MRSGPTAGPNVPTSSVAKRSHWTPAELSPRRDCFANRRNGSVLLPVRIAVIESQHVDRIHSIHFRLASTNCRDPAVIREGQPYPRKPTNRFFSPSSLQCQLPTYGEPRLAITVEPG